MYGVLAQVLTYIPLDIRKESDSNTYLTSYGCVLRHTLVTLPFQLSVQPLSLSVLCWVVDFDAILGKLAGLFLCSRVLRGMMTVCYRHS